MTELGRLHFNTRAAQGREYGRKVRHHRVISGFVNFPTAQAFRRTVPNGSDDACGAIWWQRRGQPDHDVPEHAQTHCDRVKIA